MKLGVFAKTFKGTTPHEVLSAAGRAGYRVVQYNLACSGLGSLPDAVPDVAAEAVRIAAAGTGVEIAAVSATYNMIHPDLAERARGRRSFAAIAAAAGRMGTRLVTVCTGTRDPEDQWRHHRDNSSPGAWRDLCVEMGRLLEIAERLDLLIGVEPELANVVNTPERALTLIEELRSPRLRIVLDPANLFELADSQARRDLVEGAIALLGGHIALAHAKDRFADGRFAPAGQGVIDFGHFLGALQRASFQGAVITHGLSGADAPAVAAFLRTTLATLERGA